MKWMRADIVFPDRRAVLIVSRSDALRHEEILGVMRRGGDVTDKDLPVIHDALMAVIEKERPDLKGTSIHFIGYEISSDAWHIGIAHPSLEPVEWGAPVHRIGLNPKVNFNYPPSAFDTPTVVRN